MVPRRKKGSKVVNGSLPTLYKVGETVLCFQAAKSDPRLYEAKVLQIFSVPEGGIEYEVHYQRWPKRYDECVPEVRVLSCTEDNLRIKQEIDLATSDEAKKKSTTAKRKSTTVNHRTDSNSNTGSLAHSKADNEDSTKPRKNYVEPEEAFNVKQEIHIPIPDVLKQALCEDWNYIVRRRDWYEFPSPNNTVDSVLADYVQYVTENRSEDASTADDLCVGIKEYFNSMIMSNLLYKSELEQLYECEEEWDESKGEFPVKNLSSLLGPRYLLRLFTKLGNCLAYTGLEMEAMDLLIKNVEDLLKFLEMNFKVYFPYSDLCSTATIIVGEAKDSEGASEAKDSEGASEAKDSEGASEAKDTENASESKGTEGDPGAKDIEGASEAKGTEGVSEAKDTENASESKGTEGDPGAKDTMSAPKANDPLCSPATSPPQDTPAAMDVETTLACTDAELIPQTSVSATVVEPPCPGTSIISVPEVRETTDITPQEINFNGINVA